MNEESVTQDEDWPDEFDPEAKRVTPTLRALFPQFSRDQVERVSSGYANSAYRYREICAAAKKAATKAALVVQSKRYAATAAAFRQMLEDLVSEHQYPIIGIFDVEEVLAAHRVAKAAEAIFAGDHMALAPIGERPGVTLPGQRQPLTGDLWPSLLSALRAAGVDVTQSENGTAHRYVQFAHRDLGLAEPVWPTLKAVIREFRQLPLPKIAEWGDE